MANRRSLANKRNDASVGLRPVVGDPHQWDAALRSDFSYIPEDLDPPQAFLYSRDLSWTEIEVSFEPTKLPVDPNFGAPTEVALVRSPSGFPATLLDGIMVRRHPPTEPENGGWVKIPDTGLTPGAWYYYGLFAKYFSEGNTYWLRVATSSILLPNEYLSADHLWERIPEWYRRADMEPGGITGVLRRWIDVVGYQTDAHRTWASTVGDVWDAEKIGADLLPYLGQTLGQPVEYAAGDERYRALLSRILPLRKLKGTELGTEAYISSLTGYRTRVYSGLNLLPTVDEAEAKYSNGMWAFTGTGTFMRIISDGSATPGPAYGTSFHRMTSTTASSQQMNMRLGASGTVDLSRMIPVEAGHSYVTSAFFRSSFTGTFTVQYLWYNALKQIVGTSPVVNFGAIGPGWIRRLTPSTVAPAGAAFVVLSLQLSAATAVNGLTIEATDIQFTDKAWRPEDLPGSANTPPLSGTNPGEYDDVGYYEPPRTVHVNVYPQRINFALNSLFSMDNIPAGWWTVGERATWGLLKQAYDSWGDIHDEQVGDSEADWGDLAEGFESLAGDWTITFEVANKRLRLNPSGKPTGQISVPGDLNTVTGYVSTPDTPNLRITSDVRFTAYIRDDSAESATSRMIATKQQTASAPASWRFGYTSSGTFRVAGYPSGTITPETIVHSVTRASMGLTPSGTDRYVGTVLTGVNAASAAATLRAQMITSTDGVTWTNVGAQSAAVAGNAMSSITATPLNVGLAHQGRIHWAQMETIDGAGNPTGIVWRFDPSDYTSGTSYVDPRGRTWTLSTPGAITPPVRVSGYTAQVQSGFIPITAGDSLSAAFEAWSTIAGVQMTLGVQFFTDDAPEYQLSIDGVNQDIHGAAQTLTESPYRYELRNAVAPEGAAYARVVVETHHVHTTAYSAYLAEALIENSQIPGTYFNGDDVDAAYGDYFFIGLPHQSYSVYYQNYRSFINDAGGGDRITSLMDELLPLETDFVVRTAAAGLY